MAQGIVTIKVATDTNDIDGLSRRVKSVLGSVDDSVEKSGSFFKKAFSFGAIAGVAQTAIGAVGGAVKDLVGEAVSASDSLDKFQSTLKFAGFDQKEIDKSSAAVKKYADETVYELGDVANTTAQLAANGIKDYNGLTQAAGNLNAVAGGNKETFKSVGMVLTQTAGAGKLTTENWNQLADAIPGASGMLQEAMKKNGAYTGNFRDAMEDGQITAEEFNKAITDLGMSDAAKEAATSTKTFEGAFGALQANVVSGLQGIIDALGKGNLIAVINAASTAVTWFFDLIIKGINFVKPYMETIGTLFKAFFELIKNGPGPEILKLNKQFGDLLPSSVWLGMIQFAHVIMDVRDAIKAVVGVVSGSIKSFSDFENLLGGVFSKETTQVLYELGNGIKQVIERITGLFSSTKKSKTNIDLFDLALKILKASFLSFLGPIGLFIQAFGLIGKLFGGKEIQNGTTTIGNSVTQLVENIKKQGPMIGQSFGAALEGILSAIGAALPGIVSGALQVVGGFILGIAQGLPQLALVASQLIMAFTGAMLVLIPTITASALMILSALTTALVTYIPAVVASITLIIVSILGAIASALPQILAAGAQVVLSFMQGITAQLPALVGSAATLIITWLTSLNAYMPQILQAGFNLLLTFLQGIADNIGQVTQKALDIIINFAQVIAKNMPTIVNTAVDLMVNFVGALASRMPDIVTSAATLIAKFVNGIADNLDQIIDAAANLIIKFLKGIADKLPDIIDAGMDLVEAVGEGVVQAQGRLMDIVIEMINGMAKNIESRQEDIRTAAWNLLQAMVGVFVPDELFNVGRQLIEGLVNGIDSMVDWARRSIENIGSSIMNSVTRFFGINSPSRKMRDEVGRYLPQGIAVGIEADSSQAVQAMEKMGQKIQRTGIDMLTPQEATGILSSRNSSGNTQINTNTSKVINSEPNITINVHVENAEDIEKTIRDIDWREKISGRGAMA